MNRDFDKQTEFFFNQYNREKMIVQDPDTPLTDFLLKNYYFNTSRKIISEIEKINQTENFSILEVGCGSGDYLLIAADHFKRGQFTGIDVSSEAIGLAQKNLESRKVEAADPYIRRKSLNLGDARVDFVKANAENLPFKNGIFDFIYVTMLFHHTYSHIQIIAEARRVLKPGGKILIIDLNGHNAFQKIMIRTIFKILPQKIKKRIFRNSLYLSNDEIPERSSVSVKDVRKNLQKQSFALEEIEHAYWLAKYPIFLIQAINRRGFDRFARPIVLFFIWLEKKFKKYFGAAYECYIVAAHKKADRVVLFNVADFTEKSFQPTLGLSYLKVYAEKHLDAPQNFEIKILRSKIMETIEKEQPEIVGISAVTQHYTRAVKVAKQIKKLSPRSKLIIGGVHISTLPESFDAIFDVGVIGEGEKTFTELLNFYCAGEFYRENFQKIDGLVYFQDNELRKTASRRLIENLDEVPPVDRSAFNIRGITHVVSSRGCPYACAFCSSSHFWGGRNVRYHSAEYVFGELKELIAKYKVSYITFWDDLFVADTNRLRKLVVLMDGEKKLFKNVSISANCRANIVTPELCELMLAAHIKFVTMGLESGSDAVLRTIKGAVNVEQNKRAIDILKRYGFNVQASFIIGNPDETEKDIAATYDFIKNSNLDGGCVNVAIPMPATSYWQHGKDRGLVNEKMDFGKLTVKTKFRALKPEDDFILLTDKVDRGAFVEWGRKIEKTLDAKSARSALSLNFIFSKSAILLAIKNPALAIKRLFYLVAGSLKNLWRG